MSISIIIPTFNRERQASRQIKFLAEEILALGNKKNIEVTVSDNGSDRSISDRLLKITEKYNFKYRRNDTNLGLVGNLLACIMNQNGDYIWYVSDDDILLPGILKAVLLALEKRPNLVFINHCAKDHDRQEMKLESALPYNWVDRNSGNLLDVYLHSGTTMMLITACVYSRASLILAVRQDKEEKKRLSAPLYWSLYCGKTNNVEYLTKIYIENIWGKSSWDAEGNLVFGVFVPRDLQKALFMGYRLSQAFPIFFKMKLREVKYRWKFRALRNAK